MKKYILCGCTYLLTGLLLWSPALHAQQNAHMSGRYFQVEFDEHKGLFSVRHNNKLLVNNARLEIQTEVGLIKSSEQGMAFASVIAEFSPTTPITKRMDAVSVNKYQCLRRFFWEFIDKN